MDCYHNLAKMDECYFENNIDTNFSLFHLKCQQSFTGELPDNALIDGCMAVRSCTENIDIYKSYCLLSEDDFSLSMRQVVVADLCRGELDRIIKGYFRSNYMALWMRWFVNRPEDKLPPSFGWHIDSGPMRHLKLLLYLNHPYECDGVTQILDLGQTERVKRVGYPMCGLERRISDIEELSKVCGFECTSSSFQLNAGDGILFEPFSILHRARWPTFGARYVIQICFIPSIEPIEDVGKLYDLPRYTNAWPTFK